jgi:hypothetical protein
MKENFQYHKYNFYQQIKHDASGLQTALNITGLGDNQWKTSNVSIQHPIINQNGLLGADIMLVNTDNIDDVFHGIEVDITRTSISTSNNNLYESTESLIFPNPTSSVFYWDENIEPDEINIYNIHGQLLTNITKPITNSISLINFEKGLYYIEFLKENKIIFTKKVYRE